jgi:hypothetical protein
MTAIILCVVSQNFSALSTLTAILNILRFGISHDSLVFRDTQFENQWSNEWFFCCDTFHMKFWDRCLKISILQRRQLWMIPQFLTFMLCIHALKILIILGFLSELQGMTFLHTCSACCRIFSLLVILSHWIFNRRSCYLIPRCCYFFAMHNFLQNIFEST